MRSSDDSELGPPKKLRRAIKLLADKNPALLEAPLAYLPLYTQEFEGPKIIERTPPLQYCLRQCFLSFQDICRMLQKRTLKIVLLRENIMNLISLGNSISKKYPETAEPFCAQLVKLIAMLEELDHQLAEVTGMPTINWMSIVSTLKAMSHAMKKNVVVTPTNSLVPWLEDFTVSRTLGRGGFGAVYKGVFRDSLEVAIKLVPQSKLRLDSKSESAYMDKMVAATIPNHPFICRLYCAFVASSRTNPSEICASITVMEAIDGAEMIELTNKVKALSFATIQSITLQLLMAVEHMHFSGFVHRDIKLGNILLTREGRVKLIDFDVNKLCIALAGSQHHISFFARTALEFVQGDKAGTEAYMAPEVHQMKEFGRASDWWSVGVVIFRLAYGRLPFRGQELVNEIINDELDWEKIKTGPAKMPKGCNLKEYVSQLLSKDPKLRLGSKNYIDLFDERIFPDINWATLPNSVTVTEDMEKMFLAKSKGSAGARTPMADNTTICIEDLVDFPGEHQKLLTFSSRLIRHRLSEHGDNKDVNELKDDSIAFRHCAQLTKFAEDTTCATTTTDDKKKIKEPVQVILHEFKGRKMCRSVAPVQVQRLLCEDGLYRFTVTEVHSQVKFLSEPRLYTGDLVTEIDKIPLLNLQHARVKSMLLKTGAPLVLTVAQKNAFRDLAEGTLNFDNYMYLFKPIKIVSKPRIKRNCLYSKVKPNHGFQLVLRKIFVEGNAECICLVSKHEIIWQKYSTDTNIFTGDIVLSINQKRFEKLSRVLNANELLKNMLDVDQLEVEFLPCSLLRTSNLPRT